VSFTSFDHYSFVSKSFFGFWLREYWKDEFVSSYIYCCCYKLFKLCAEKRLMILFWMVKQLLLIWSHAMVTSANWRINLSNTSTLVCFQLHSIFIVFIAPLGLLITWVRFLTYKFSCWCYNCITLCKTLVIVILLLLFYFTCITLATYIIIVVSLVYGVSIILAIQFILLQYLRISFWGT